MKKIILLAFASICLFISASAQKEKKTYFGIKGGLNHINIHGRETDGDKTGFTGTTIYGALFVESKIGATTFLTSELLFTWLNDWHFIEVPFQIEQLLNKRFSVFLGPKLDFMADRFDNKDENKSDFIGVSVEGGTRFNIFKRFFAEGRYTIGISKQFRDEYFDINDGRRNNLRFGLGYRF